MVRLIRITSCGVPVHIIQRSNNRQVIFADTPNFIKRLRPTARVKLWRLSFITFIQNVLGYVMFAWLD